MVYFSRGDGTCAAHLAKARLEGGEEVALPGSGRLGPEARPAVHPNGSHIAFTRYYCETNQEEIVMARLTDEASGEQRFAHRAGRLVWSPDGRLLAWDDLPSQQVPNNFAWIKVWEMGQDGAVGATHEIQANSGCTVAGPTFMRDGLLVAAEICGPQGEADSAFVIFDPPSGIRRGVLLALPPSILGVPFAFDSSGGHMLYLTVEDTRSDIIVSQQSQVPPELLHRLEITTGRSVKIGEDGAFHEAVW